MVVQELNRPHVEQRIRQAWAAGGGGGGPSHDCGQAHVPSLPDPGPDPSQRPTHLYPENRPCQGRLEYYAMNVCWCKVNKVRSASGGWTAFSVRLNAQVFCAKVW